MLRKEESVNTILDMADLKQTGRLEGAYRIWLFDPAL